MPMQHEDERQGRPASFTREPVGPKSASSKGGTGDQALMDAIAIIVVALVVLVLLGFSLRSHSA